MNEKNRKEKNGGAEGGSWCEKESHKEAGEYPAKVGWNGCVARMEGAIDKESGCTWSGG